MFRVKAYGFSIVFHGQQQETLAGSVLRESYPLDEIIIATREDFWRTS
jgi:hypothetical protein